MLTGEQPSQVLVMEIVLLGVFDVFLLVSWFVARNPFPSSI